MRVRRWGLPVGGNARFSIKNIVVLIVLTAVTAACGQKTGVADDPSLAYLVQADDGLSSLPAPVEGAGPEGSISPNSGPTETSYASSGVSSIDPSSSPAGSTQGDSPSGLASEPGTSLDSDRPPAGGSKTGLTPSTIKIGLHLPFHVAPFSHGATRLYWLDERVEGRKVEIVLVDDGYRPEAAHEGCRELIERERVFAILGFAGPFQIQACARVAAQAGVPYLALGSSEALLQGLSTQFSVSVPYPGQVGLVADVLVDELQANERRNGFLRVAGGVRAESQMLIDEIESRGVHLQAKLRVPADAQYEEFEQAALYMKQRRIENVVFAASPLQFSYFVNAAAKNGYFPRLTGPGLTTTFDEFLNVTCPNGRAGHGALFFSPFPAFQDHARWDPEFAEAGGTNDVDWMFWSYFKAIDALFSLPGENLTRERLIWYVARARHIETGLMPPISFTPEDRFSDRSMHLLRANCSTRQWENYRNFVRP